MYSTSMRYILVALAVFSLALAVPIEDDALQEFTRGNRRLTAAIYKELARENRGNIVVSPFSVETVLSLAYEGARGQTATELVSGLYLPNTNEKVQNAFRSLLPKLQSSSGNLKLASANKIYLREGVRLEDQFTSIASRVYGSAVENVDFSRSEELANEINRWVEEQTNNEIRNLVDANSINEDSVMVLVNTLYLSGRWKRAFNRHPIKIDFYRGYNDVVKVDTMWQGAYLNYWENSNLNAKFLEIPLEGANISLVIALPYDVNGLSRLEENIEEVLELPPQPEDMGIVRVNLPIFNIESKIQFVPVLENLGIRRVFRSDADLSGISSTDQNIYITDVVQKAIINVTESGIQASVATDISGEETSWIPTTADFRADHPFLYYVQDNGVILFSGRYVDPMMQ